MGTIIKFPANAAARRLGVDVAPILRNTPAQVLILPVIRIERHVDDHGQGPDEGTAQRRPRKRRARS